MDEDSKMIEDLQANCEQLKARVLQLEKTLKQEILKKEEFRKLKNDELHKSNEVIDDLKQKLANCLSIIDSKNIELLNLQTALGQYYAESEAKVSSFCLCSCFENLVYNITSLCRLSCFGKIDCPLNHIFLTLIHNRNV